MPNLRHLSVGTRYVSRDTIYLWERGKFVGKQDVCAELCLYVGMLYVCGNALCLLECFMSVGTLYVCRNAICLWE